MSYFNHAYRKSFLASKATQAADGSHKGVEDGFLLEAGVHTRFLKKTSAPYALGVGTFGFFNPATYLSVDNTWVTNNPGKPLILASASLLSEDKVGPFHGGYQESNKSKLINPRYVNKVYRSEGADAEPDIYHIGNTNYFTGVAITTAGASLTNGAFTAAATTGGSGTGLTVTGTVAGGLVTAVAIASRGAGYKVGDVVSFTTGGGATAATLTLTANCSFDFYCGETYNLQVNLWGSPVLRVLNHDAYRTLAAYTGCCAGATPTKVDSTLVMIDWAKQILKDVYLKDFIKPIVYTELGVKLDTLAAMEAYVSPGHTTGKTAGIRLASNFTETKFNDEGSFRKSDFYEKEIVRIKAQLVDLGGNPCTFVGLCVKEEAAGYQGQGYGETVLRDFILDESYLTNHFHDDPRLRQVNQGDDIYNAIARNGKYNRYVIIHSVPRLSNPTGVFDNDQYALTIYMPKSFGTATAFETFLTNFLAGANNPIAIEADVHTAYVPDAL